MLSVDPQDREKTLTSFVGKNYKFMNIIGQYVNGLKFLPQDAEYTYIFEFIHEASYVLTKYTPEQFGLYLIGGRHVPSHKELSEQELDEVALRIGARRPRRWDSKANYAEIEKMMRELSAATKDFEGFVFRDKATGKRLKVKDAEYVRRHHMLDDARSIKSLLPIILQGEEDELLAYYPHAAERAVEIKQAYAEYIDKVVGRIKEWQAKGLDRQALAYAVFGHNTLSKWELKSMKAKGEELPKVIPGEPDEFIREMTMKHYKVQDENVLRQIIDNTLSGIALGQGKNAGNPKKLMDIIGLRDKEEVTPDLGEI
jgi:hypothetical protein